MLLFTVARITSAFTNAKHSSSRPLASRCTVSLARSPCTCSSRRPGHERRRQCIHAMPRLSVQLERLSRRRLSCLMYCHKHHSHTHRKKIEFTALALALALTVVVATRRRRQPRPTLEGSAPAAACRTCRRPAQSRAATPRASLASRAGSPAVSCCPF